MELPPALIEQFGLPPNHNAEASENRIVFHVARLLHMTEARLRSEMTWAEFRRWVALLKVEAAEREQAEAAAAARRR